MLDDVWILGYTDSLNLDATDPNFEFVSWNLTFLQKHLQSTLNSYFFEEWACSFWSQLNHFRPKWLSLFSQDPVGILKSDWQTWRMPPNWIQGTSCCIQTLFEGSLAVGCQHEICCLHRGKSQQISSWPIPISLLLCSQSCLWCPSAV